MIAQQMVHHPESRRASHGFSLVEVTISIGILAFCMIPLLGLIPTGLNAQRDVQERIRATVALNMLSTAIHSAQFVSRDTTGAATYRLPQYLSDSTTPATNPTTFTTGAAPSTYTYAILEDGTIRKRGDTTQAKETMYVQFFPPSTDARLKDSPTGSNPTPSAAVGVYVFIAWPSSPNDSSTTGIAALKNRQGFLESFISYVPTY